MQSQLTFSMEPVDTSLNGHNTTEFIFMRNASQLHIARQQPACNCIDKFAIDIEGESKN